MLRPYQALENRLDQAQDLDQVREVLRDVIAEMRELHERIESIDDSVIGR